MSSRRAACFLLMILSCFCTAFGPPTLTDSDIPRKSLTLQQLRIMYETPAPDLTSDAALLVNTTTGRILYAFHERERRAPASLTKIVTALVALDRGRLDQEFRVRNEDLRAGTVVRLQNGERLNLNDLLKLMLIPSDNAASMTIARGLGGDVRTYVGWMNDLVSRWGLTDTRFANPHGLDDDDGYSTAYDTAIIARYALSDPVLAEIVRSSQAVVGDRLVKSTNELLGSYPGAVGIKTGTTDRAGECLVSAVDRHAGQALAVVLGSGDRFRDSRLLLDYFYANYAELRIDVPATPQARYLDQDNNWHEIRLQQPLTMLISPWQVGTATFYRRIDDISPNPDPNKPVGALEITLAGRYVDEVPLYAR